MPTSSAASSNSAPPEAGDERSRQRDALLALLLDSLLHDARNPLNALSINLEVLCERLRRDAGGPLSAAHEKSLRSMREQINRVDAILGRYFEFIAPAAEPAGAVDFSALTQRAFELMGHDARRRRVELRPQIEAGVRAISADPPGLKRAILMPISEAIADAEQGSEVTVIVKAERGQAVLRVEGDGPQSPRELYLPLE